MSDFLANLLAWLQPSNTDFPSLVPVAIFLCILFLVEGIYFFIKDSRGKSDKRIKARLNFIQGLEDGTASASLIKSEILAQDSKKKEWLSKINRLFNVDELLLQADLPWKSSMVIMVSVLLGVIAGFYGYLQFGISGGAVAFFSAAFSSPTSY